MNSIQEKPAFARRCAEKGVVDDVLHPAGKLAVI
jgi:hypothetical protein